MKNPILIFFSTIVVLLFSLTIYFVLYPSGLPKSNLTEVVSPETATPNSAKPIVNNNTIEFSVYFLNDQQYNIGQEPYETAVKRFILKTLDPKQAVIDELFKGPTTSEQAKGLRLVTSGTTGAKVSLSGNVATVTLLGPCASGGSTYTIANLITKNLEQFKDVSRVTFQLEADKDNLSATSTSDLPDCLQP